MIVVHGIPNCDSVRRARAWLTERGLDHRLRDLRAEPPEEAEVRRWAEAVGWERLLNRRGTTWRGLAEIERAGVDEGGAVALLAAHPLLVKRPVIDWGTAVTVGVDERVWEERIQSPLPSG